MCVDGRLHAYACACTPVHVSQIWIVMVHRPPQERSRLRTARSRTRESTSAWRSTELGPDTPLQLTFTFEVRFRLTSNDLWWDVLSLHLLWPLYAYLYFLSIPVHDLFILFHLIDFIQQSCRGGLHLSRTLGRSSVLVFWRVYMWKWSFHMYPSHTDAEWLLLIPHTLNIST